MGGVNVECNARNVEWKNESGLQVYENRKVKCESGVKNKSGTTSGNPSHVLNMDFARFHVFFPNTFFRGPRPRANEFAWGRKIVLFNAFKIARVAREPHTPRALLNYVANNWSNFNANIRCFACFYILLRNVSKNIACAKKTSFWDDILLRGKKRSIYGVTIVTEEG